MLYKLTLNRYPHTMFSCLTALIDIKQRNTYTSSMCMRKKWLFTLNVAGTKQLEM